MEISEGIKACMCDLRYKPSIVGIHDLDKNVTHRIRCKNCGAEGLPSNPVNRYSLEKSKNEAIENWNSTQ
jgi:hypothetical protein